MTIALLVLQLVLAAVFLVAGLRKFTHPTPEFRQLLGPGGYVTVGVLELAAAAALVLPTVTGIATALVSVAALGLVLLIGRGCPRQPADGPAPRHSHERRAAGPRGRRRGGHAAHPRLRPAPHRCRDAWGQCQRWLNPPDSCLSWTR